MEKKKTEEKKTKPYMQFGSGLVHASIWENEREKDGKKFTAYSVSIDRAYKDGEEWKHTNSYNTNDLVRLRLVIDESIRFLMLDQEEEKE